MNKKIMLIFCLFGLMACSDSDVTTKTLSYENTQEIDSIAPNKVSNNQSPKHLGLKPEEYTSTNLDSLGIELMALTKIGGVKIGMDTAQVAEILGQPEVKSDQEEWAVDGGVHEFWYYSDSCLVLEFVNYSYHEDNNLEIIELRDSCEFKTDRNIYIGSNIEIVKSNYAKAIELSDWKEGENQILLGDPGSAGLFFTICDNLICNIRIGAIIRC